MHNLMIIAIIVGGMLCLGVTFHFVHRFFLQRILPPTECQMEFAKDANVCRRHLESIDAWQDRAFAAHRAKSCASTIFFREAQTHGTVVNHDRAFMFSLPQNHPASVLCLCANYPDGPSFEELAAIAGFDPEPWTRKSDAS